MRDLRRRVSGRDKEKRERGWEREKEIEILKDEGRNKQAELTIDWTPSKEAIKILEHPPRNLRDVSHQEDRKSVV